MKDWYKILQISPKACDAVVSAAYTALMKINHPDVAGRTTLGVVARDLNQAREILTDSLKRKDFDKDRQVNLSKQVGPYKVLEIIAEGGFGRTYKAEHSVNKKLACIKDCSNLSAEDAAMLVQESTVLWDLRHYALPAMKDILQLDDGRVLLVMSYIPGLTLEKEVARIGAIEPESVAWITERILNALNYIHRHGVVHGDLKPQNIIVQADMHMAVLVDFGLSLVKPSSNDASKGYTPYFAPPEAIDGKPLIPESDYFSLGMTMIYALGGGPDHVMHKQVPANVPDELCNFIKRLIARDVNSRPQYGKEDLCDTIVELRNKVFGRRRSMMKPIGGVK